ncbi:MAG: RagB/SusD family nutrient uptake outer membrane protein [Dysgonamonadaceae bacterium]|jgi:hypothetical protein|nr:RagB/SusD family nutrient uptake outer membrane protein [Dysgonamonadaceae bacterium]
MKNKNIFISCFFGALLILAACEEWLDVKPKSQVEGSELFRTESGFKDALTGVYTALTSNALYGREMTFGFVDCIGDAYYGAGTNTVHSYAKSHLYDNASVEALIGNIWSGCYNAIATLNNILENLETADTDMFSRDNYNVIKGEALGLRAFLHFDLLRLFAPSWASDPEAAAIPYVTTYGYQTTPLSTVREVMEKILDDLNQSTALLKASDPVATGRVITASDDNGYLLHRYFHFNYYAAKATLARVYLYKQDAPNARTCATEVINGGMVSWTSVNDMATAQDSARDRTFVHEQAFALQVDNMESYVLGYTYGTVQYNARFTIYVYWMNYSIWPTATHSTDWRRVYLTSNSNTNSGNYYTTSKLWQAGMGETHIKRMPLIRLPEMYLILAETETDIAAALGHLNTIRENRGVTAPATAVDAAALQSEVELEYYREYVGEGYLFYYYKRLDRPTHRGGSYFYANTLNFNKEWYVLPIPKEEIEYGNRN